MPIKVRRRTAVNNVLAAGILALFATAGCGGPEEAAPPAGEVEASDQFGDPYTVVPNFLESAPDISPMILGDSLMIMLTYAGGCEDHDFTLDYEVERDTARLWLRHDANGDDCEALLRDEFSMPLPDDVREAPAVVFLTPEGGTPATLRWRE